MFLSHRDCIQAFEKALEIDRKYLLAYVISNNTRKVFNLEETKQKLNFHPIDNSDDYF